MNRILFLLEKSLKKSRACETVDLCTPAGDGRYKIYGGVSPRELLNYRTFLKNIGVKLRMQRTKKLALAFIKLKDHDILYRSMYIGKIEPLSEPARHIFELRQMRSSDIDKPDLILEGEIDVPKFFWPPTLRSRCSSPCRRKERSTPTWKIPPT